MTMDNPFAAIAQAITGGQPPAAQPGQQAGPWGPGTSLIGTPLDLLLGPSEALHRERLQQTGANDRLASTQGEARRKEDTELAAAQELAAEYQRSLTAAGGDRNQALRSVMASPAFVRAFSHGSVDKLVSILKGDRDLNTPQAPIVTQTPQGGQTNIFDPANPLGDPVRTITNPREVSRNTGMDRVAATRLGAIQTEGEGATEEMRNLQELREALQRVGPTGFKAGLRARAAAWGIDVANATDLQIAQAMVDRLTPRQRVPGSGATSDREMATFRSGLTDFFRTQGANSAILDNLQAHAERRIAQGNLANRVFSGEMTQQQAFAAMANPPDPSHEEFRNATGEDIAQVRGMTDQQLSAYTQRMVQRFGTPLPPTLARAIRREAERIERALGR